MADKESAEDAELRKHFIPVPLGPEIDERIRRGLLDVELFPRVPPPQAPEKVEDKDHG